MARGYSVGVSKQTLTHAGEKRVHSGKVCVSDISKPVMTSSQTLYGLTALSLQLLLDETLQGNYKGGMCYM